MLPQLRELEQSFSDQLVVIGVHAGKFWAERDTTNIRQAALRLNVPHPIVNDRFFRTWREYAVSAWPTLVMIDPEGYIVDSHAGEITADGYAPLIAQLIDEFAKRGSLNTKPIHFESDAAGEPPRQLAFPTKILSDGQRLYVADTGHNRVLVLHLNEDGTSGSLEKIIGQGDQALRDGEFQSAAFAHPQGMAILGTSLYVADTLNHAIRAVNLVDQTVTTVAGNGEQARGVHIAGYGPSVPLSSPWDVAIHGRGLYVAMAGIHQIWRLDLATTEIRPYAGTGAEAIVDGTRTSAALAQTTGLTVNDNQLIFVDSESSSVRMAELPPGNDIRTLVGTGLFNFGDEDGIGDKARLQHDQGVVWYGNVIYVADTYNNKIRTIDPSNRAVTTFAGNGRAGWQDGNDAQFWEPGGLTVANNRLYIADTNNHAVRIIDVATKNVATLSIEGLHPS